MSTDLRGGRLLIVGVARDFVFGSLNRPAEGTVVTARGWLGGIDAHFSVRAANPRAIQKPIVEALKAAVPDAAVTSVRTGQDLVAHDLGRQRLGAWFFSGFGLVALLLGVLGVFGLVAYLAESRQREFGIRVALGATPEDLIRRSLKAALIPVSVGLAAGLLGAACVARLLTSLLTGLSSLNPITYASVAAVTLACATAAGLVGAWPVASLGPPGGASDRMTQTGPTTQRSPRLLSGVADHSAKLPTPLRKCRLLCVSADYSIALYLKFRKRTSPVPAA